MNRPTIAIDGPAGSGKSTVAKCLSHKYGIYYLDTGAMYRAVAYKIIKDKIDLTISGNINKVCDDLFLEIKFKDNVQHTFIDGEDVSDKIRTEEISCKTSEIATNMDIRLKLVEIQRDFARKYGCIMDGRDIGSYVLPDADYKFYLTASLEERAARRCNEYAEKGQLVDPDDLKSRIKERDNNDMTRKFAPLIKAHDAIEIDTTGLDIDNVISKIVSYIRCLEQKRL